MNKNLFLKLPLTILLVLSGFFNGIFAQNENKSISDLKIEAKMNFDKGNYPESLTQYRSLLARYPKDGMYSYYCGLSLLNMNRDFDAAIEYLEFASSNATVPYHVFYFLGDAYTRNYQFTQARKAYTQFASVATKTEEKDLMPLRLAEMSENAIMLTRSFNEVDIVSSSLFTFQDSSYISLVRSPGGTLSQKPSVLLPSADGIKDISNLMFIPRNTEKGDLLFFAGNGKTKKKGNDIFMVKTINGKKYSEPVALDALNTDYDEIMPYYDPIGKDLFFASKGHSSMGGFDLFKSHYDLEHDTWTPPVNLGFPLNSPFDEYLVIPGTDLGSIMLVTGRHGLDSMVTTYELRIHEPRNEMVNADPLELKRIGNFGGVEALTQMLNSEPEFSLSDEEVVSESYVSKKPKPGDLEGGAPVDYNKYLKLALEEQFKADSLARLARESRIQLKTIPDAEERWTVQKNVISWEKQSADLQAKADEYYLMIRHDTNETPGEKKVPEAIVEDTVISGIKVYNYYLKDSISIEAETVSKSVSPEIKEEEPSPEIKAETVIADNYTPKVKADFGVLDKSPYSENNPFPEEKGLPKGSYYKIQLAVLSKDPDWNAFGGLMPVTFENVSGKPMKRFYAGKFSDFNSAKDAQEEVRRNGFPEAFIVAWYDGVKMTVSKVVELEKR